MSNTTETDGWVPKPTDETTKSSRRVVQILEAEEWINDSSPVVIEGPPVYPFYPNLDVSEHDSRNPDSPTYQLGMQIMQSFLNTQKKWIPSAMLDNVHGIDEASINCSGEDPRVYTPELKNVLFEYATGIFGTNRGPNEWLLMESAFQHEDADLCSLMDARYQMDKINRLHKAGVQLHQIRILIIHPEDYVTTQGRSTEQQLMLQQLLRLMKTDPLFKQMPKTGKRAFIERSIRYVSVSSGGLHQVLKPIYDNNGGFEMVDLICVM